MLRVIACWQETLISDFSWQLFSPILQFITVCLAGPVSFSSPITQIVTRRCSDVDPYTLQYAWRTALLLALHQLLQILVDLRGFAI